MGQSLTEYVFAARWYYDQPTPEWRWIIVSAAVQWAVQFIGDLVGTMIDQVGSGKYKHKARWKEGKCTRV